MQMQVFGCLYQYKGSVTNLTYYNKSYNNEDQKRVFLSLIAITEYYLNKTFPNYNNKV